MIHIAVIIPYYQSRPGILKRALDSVFAQAYQHFHIIIVDDGARQPVANELVGFLESQKAKVTVISQKNAGPAFARNSGLNAVTADMDMVAFLDSDDIWFPCHLANAVKAHETWGADMYFSALKPNPQYNMTQPFSTLVTRGIASELEPDGWYELQDKNQTLLPDWFLYFHISSLVMSAPLASSIRFNTRLRYASEDFLFRIEASIAAKKIVICSEYGADRADGDNHFHNSRMSHGKIISQQIDNLKGRHIAVRLLRQHGAKLDFMPQEFVKRRHHAISAVKEAFRAGKPLTAFTGMLRIIIVDPAIMWFVIRYKLLGYKKEDSA